MPVTFTQAVCPRSRPALDRAARRRGRGTAAVVIALPSQARWPSRDGRRLREPAGGQLPDRHQLGHRLHRPVHDHQRRAAAVTGWTLGFQLPVGTSVSSPVGRLLHRRRRPGDGDQRQLGRHHRAGRIGLRRLRDHVHGPGRRNRPTALINGASCQAGGGARARPRPPARRHPPARSSTPPPSTSASPSAVATSVPIAVGRHPPRAPRPARRRPGRPGSPRTSTRACSRPSTWSRPPQATGVKQFNLAFVVSGGGGCTPEWGGVTAIGDDPVAAADRRAARDRRRRADLVRRRGRQRARADLHQRLPA